MSEQAGQSFCITSRFCSGFLQVTLMDLASKPSPGVFGSCRFLGCSSAVVYSLFVVAPIV